jgi:hypothetical protein
MASALLFSSTLTVDLTVDGGTLTTGDDTLVVSGGTLIVDGGTLTAGGDTLVVGGGTLMSDGQHRLGSTIACMTQ